jgi:hypothetical protein
MDEIFKTLITNPLQWIVKLNALKTLSLQFSKNVKQYLIQMMANVHSRIWYGLYTRFRTYASKQSKLKKCCNLELMSSVEELFTGVPGPFNKMTDTRAEDTCPQEETAETSTTTTTKDNNNEILALLRDRVGKSEIGCNNNDKSFLDQALDAMIFASVAMLKHKEEKKKVGRAMMRLWKKNEFYALTFEGISEDVNNFDDICALCDQIGIEEYVNDEIDIDTELEEIEDEFKLARGTISGINTPAESDDFIKKYRQWGWENGRDKFPEHLYHRDFQKDINDLLCKRLEFGRQKYGHGVNINENTRNFGTAQDSWGEMFMEETLDGMVYAAAAMLRRKKENKNIKRVAQRLQKENLFYEYTFGCIQTIAKDELCDDESSEEERIDTNTKKENSGSVKIQALCELTGFDSYKNRDGIVDALEEMETEFGIGPGTLASQFYN